MIIAYFRTLSNDENFKEDENFNTATPQAMDHCPVINFVGDPYFPPNTSEKEYPSTAVIGVLRAIYS